jgi:hypothetical protein
MNTQYESILKQVRSQFNTVNEVMFTTNVEGLYELYLANLPGDVQVHTCNACRRFIEQYGGLVTIDQQGQIKSALWYGTSDFYGPAVEAMRKAVERSKVTGVFYPSKSELGTAKTGDWLHFAVATRAVPDANQKMAQKLEEFKMMQRNLTKYKLEEVEQAFQILNSETLYRSRSVIGPIEWFMNLHENLKTSPNRANLLWKAVATAPSGWTHQQTLVTGTLLDDLADGKPFNQIKASFEAKMRPDQYQRAQAAPNVGVIQQAEKLFAEMGLAPALNRRYARLSELPVKLWTPSTVATGSLFGHLLPKAETIETPPVVMTWEKFQKKVLPYAESISASADESRFMALVTADDPKAPNLFQWDNPFSWYYAGGADAEMKRRLTREGGQFENVQVRVSLMWDNWNDLDLHVISPTGHHIYYGDRTDRRSGGYLDVDMNAGGPVSNEPVENVRWRNAPDGLYKVYVNLYTTHRNGPINTPFTVEIAINGTVQTFTGETYCGNSDNRFGNMVKVATFTYPQGDRVIPTNTYLSGRWNIRDFAPVTAIVPSPNTWNGSDRNLHHFLLLEGCKDLTHVGRGFFTEMLKSEYRPIRSVLEAHMAQAQITGEADACGIGINPDGTGNLTLKVKGKAMSGVYKIDRWD